MASEQTRSKVRCSPALNCGSLYLGLIVKSPWRSMNARRKYMLDLDTDIKGNDSLVSNILDAPWII
jgi:hypothetical protein